MNKLFLILTITLSLIIPTFSAFATEIPTDPLGETATNTTPEPDIFAEAAILMDAKTGEVLYEKNSTQKMYPASITKLMTVLLALENGDLTDEVTFSHEAVFSIEYGSAHIAMQEGEKITLEQAIYAILLRSANEVSNAVAEYVDGSVTAFAQHMTERAAELGATNTNFVNANGLFHENHYTSARDMALIGKALLENSTYRQFLNTTYHEIGPTNLQEETRYLHGQHQMLNKNSIYYYEYATGGKTGYVSESLNTLVTFAEKDGMELIAVVMRCNSAEHYIDTKALFEYGFSNYKTAKVVSTSDYTPTIDVTETYNNETTQLGTITAMALEDVYLTLGSETDLSNLSVTANYDTSISAPIKQGDTIGTLVVQLGSETLATVPLLAQETILETTEEERIAQRAAAQSALLKRAGFFTAIGIAGLLALLAITRTIGHLKREKRRKRRMEQRKKRMQQHRIQ